MNQVTGVELERLHWGTCGFDNEGSRTAILGHKEQCSLRCSDFRDPEDKRNWLLKVSLKVKCEDGVITGPGMRNSGTAASSRRQLRELQSNGTTIETATDDASVVGKYIRCSKSARRIPVDIFFTVLSVAASGAGYLVWLRNHNIVTSFDNSNTPGARDSSNFQEDRAVSEFKQLEVGRDDSRNTDDFGPESNLGGGDDIHHIQAFLKLFCATLKKLCVCLTLLLYILSLFKIVLIPYTRIQIEIVKKSNSSDQTSLIILM